jgi:hypothetical protein
MNHQHEGRAADDGQRRDVAQAVVGQLLEDAGIDRVVVGDEGDGVAIGRRLDSICVPVMPPAPGRFSMTTGWPPSERTSAVWAERTMVSAPEPAPTGRMTRSGVPFWARTPSAAAPREAPARASKVRRVG